jgi:hypothetical protein
MSTSFERDFEAARKRLTKAEAALVQALDGLSAARDSRAAASVTSAYRRAKEAEKVCATEWEVLEQIRRSYWSSCLRQAQADLESLVGPLVAKVITLNRYTGAMVPVHPHLLLSHLGHRIEAAPPMAAALPIGGIPAEPMDCPALERADDEIL